MYVNPKYRNPFMFKFQYNGEEYAYQNYSISKNGAYVCHCDLSGTEYYGNEAVTLMCCKIALGAYYQGKRDGKDEHKKEFTQKFKKLLGL